MVPTGTVIVTSRAPVGNVAIAETELCTNQGCKALIPEKHIVEPEYALQLLKSASGEVQSLAVGTTFTEISTARLGAVPIPVPPLDEQAVIVRFLSHANRELRRYIRAKQTLIKLLEEQKRAIIHRVVTRGLNPAARLKSSGIEWLGQTPDHWAVVSFSRVAIERADYRGATPEKTDSGVFLVTAKNVRRGWIDYEVSQEYVAEREYETVMRRGLPRMDDLLLTMEAPLGNAALVDRERIALAQRVIRFRFDPRVLEPRFVLVSVLAPYFQNQLLCRGTGSTALGIKASKLPQLQLLMPPLDEQRLILRHIDAESIPLDSASARANSEIALLRELRTRLVADVVTGKLDVREAAARLPDSVKDREPLEDIDFEIDSDDEVDRVDAVAEEA